MNEVNKISNSRLGCRVIAGHVYGWFAPRAHTVIICAALIFTMGTKFYHSWRYGLVHDYLSWILADLAVLLTLELVLTLICRRWPRAWVLRVCLLLATVVTTWAVINAAYLVRNGTQILPATLVPLIRNPLNNFPIVGMNLYKRPVTAVSLLGPSAIMLVMISFFLIRPVSPRPAGRVWCSRLAATLILVIVALSIRGKLIKQRPSQPATSGLQYSCHLKAITRFFTPSSSRLTRDDFICAVRVVPTPTQVHISRSSTAATPNLVMVVLEGVQHRYTSLDEQGPPLTPFMKELGEGGVIFSHMRSSLTHTTKALFSLMTGRYPSASQDVIEAVPTQQGYASLATILNRQQGYRTAFMQSAKGNFESRPSLVGNLGFDTFVARDDLNDPNVHLGYLAADEFAMLPLIRNWLAAEQEKPFFLTVLCSATHDPYLVPEWFAEPASDPVERYKQVIAYTDQYIRAIDSELAKMGLAENTLFCVVGDHGEGFGEHGKLGHDRIGFEEVVRIPWVVRLLQEEGQGRRVTVPVSSVDVTPTLLTLLGFHPAVDDFDGQNALGTLPKDRKVFFTGWAPEGAAGYVVGNRKVIHNPAVDEIVAYDLSRDPLELEGLELSTAEAEAVIQSLIAWRRHTIFNHAQEDRGKTLLYSTWLCRWTKRNPSAKYQLEYQ